MRYGGLFEGIGGFALASKSVGWINVWSNDIDKSCCEDLERNFNHKIINSDIKECGNGRTYELEKVDIIAGGIPCQPFSTAGKQKGANDDRSQWHEMFRIVSEIKPHWVIIENVVGIVKMELDNIQSDLESEGYSTISFEIPASAVSAPHPRKRIWIIANLDSGRWNSQPLFSTKSQKRYCTYDVNSTNAIIGGQKTWLAEPELGRVVYGVPRKLDKEIIKKLGNAIVPKIAFEIFSIIHFIES